MSGADAIHPGYGLPVGKPGIRRCLRNEAGITFIGPTAETMRRLGNKVAARNLAIEAGVPVMPATDPLPDDMADGAEAGRRDRLSGDAQGELGRRRARHARHPHEDDAGARCRAKREAKAAFGKDEVYLEKLVERARHVEVQILGDAMAIWCICSSATARPAPQPEGRRARAGPYLDAAKREELANTACASARA
jgi:pyruvate carboxylase